MLMPSRSSTPLPRLIGSAPLLGGIAAPEGPTTGVGESSQRGVGIPAVSMRPWGTVQGGLLATLVIC